jgi:leader peptidase (prepilin peptidase)/N-methyltransferase
MGLGDAKLMAGLGAWVSWMGLTTVVLYGGAAACLYVLLGRFSKNRSTSADRIPFGTFLALGGWLVWLYGPLISAGQV